MIEALTGHDLLASAPSWDGKWLSRLLRAAGLPRHALRLRKSSDAHLDAAIGLLRDVIAPGQLGEAASSLVAAAELAVTGPPAHRALPDAKREWLCWLKVRDDACRLAGQLRL